jgi:hypothetical protein
MTTLAINTKFDTIETIRLNKEIKNTGAAMIEACEQFLIQSRQFLDNENYTSKMSAIEVSLAFNKVMTADCGYSIYTAAHACECWLSKSWNNAD